ncbi:hypothetical protein DdX_21000 [Ditylenchus destructor]|uniref:Uncharacterized protein n=1 Tax=Ditylenchus destructor TaxID=166010 RepID=A0AAD4QRK7_9BILA|nr:hypothetical protein DdX_21000 [Ditylenchus destructor]
MYRFLLHLSLLLVCCGEGKASGPPRSQYFPATITNDKNYNFVVAQTKLLDGIFKMANDFGDALNYLNKKEYLWNVLSGTKKTNASLAFHDLIEHYINDELTPELKKAIFGDNRKPKSFEVGNLLSSLEIKCGL